MGQNRHIILSWSDWHALNYPSSTSSVLFKELFLSILSWLENNTSMLASVDAWILETQCEEETKYFLTLNCRFWYFAIPNKVTELIHGCAEFLFGECYISFINALESICATVPWGLGTNWENSAPINFALRLQV